MSALHLRLPAVLVLCILVAACDSGPGSNTVTISLDPVALDFGEVELGSRETRALVVTNDGEEPLTLGEPKLDGQDAASFVIDSAFTEVTVPAGEKLSIAVSFRPIATGRANTELSFSAAGSPRRVPLQGAGKARGIRGPHLVVMQSTPVMLSAQDASRDLVIVNAGDELLRFGRRENDGSWIDAPPEIVDSNPGELSLAWLPEGYEQEAGLAPGESVALRLSFTPRSGEPDAAALLIYSNDPVQSVALVAIRTATTLDARRCSYDIVPSSIALEIMDADPVQVSVVIRHRGGSAADFCIVRDVRLKPESSAFSLPDGPIASAPVPRGESLEIPILFTPLSDHTTSARLHLVVDGPGGGEHWIELDASDLGPASCVLVTPSELDFGAVPRCSASERTITVTNVCPIDLVVQWVESPAPFRVTRRPPLPERLRPGGSFEVGLTYRQSEGVGSGDEGSLAIDLADTLGQRDRVLVALHGTPGPLPVAQDRFVQGTPAKRDILLVIDNSPSMADKQQAISDNLAQLIDLHDSSHCFDYQIGVTTTEVDAVHGGAGSGPGFANGRFLPLDGSRPRIVTSAMPDRLQLLLQNASVGSSGTGPAFLTLPSRLALSQSLITTEHAGFLRPDADLEIFVISDSADQGTTPIADEAAFLLGLLPRTSFNAIVPMHPQAPLGCSYDEPDAGVSSRAADLAGLLQGFSHDICEPTGWFLRLNFAVPICPKRLFFLLGVPAEPNDIAVEVNWQVVPRTDANGPVWTYDSSQNAVLFEPHAIPPAGADIVFRYPVTCF